MPEVVDGRIKPVTFSELRSRLARCDVYPVEEMEDAIVFARTGSRMDIGINLFYSVAYHGEEELIYPPTIAHILGKFLVPVALWLAEAA